MAKRQITSDNQVAIRSPAQPRAQQRELEAAVEYMMNIMSKRFRNQALKELNQATVNKFADAVLIEEVGTLANSDLIEFIDAQTGNYANVFLTLAKRVRRKMEKQFDDKRIEKLVETVLNKANKHNRDTLYNLVEKRVGISTAELTATEGLTYQINALTLETSQWVKKLRDDNLEAFTANSLRAMTHGSTLEDVMSQFDGMVEKRKNHAKMVARTQIANFNSVTTKIRAQNLGITRAKWITSRDERVRRCHQLRNGKEFDLDKGLYSSCDGKHLLPGVDYQCRCDYELIIPGADS